MSTLITQVSFEEVGGGIEDGVVARATDQIGVARKRPVVDLMGGIYRMLDQDDDSWRGLGRSTGGGEIVLVTKVHTRDLQSGNPWIVFDSQGVGGCDRIGPASVRRAGDWFVVRQRFEYYLADPARLGFVQFCCGARKAHHAGQVYRERDIVTHYVTRPLGADSMVAVMPTAEQTFVPMQPGQRMRLIVGEGEEVVFRPLEGGGLVRGPGVGASPPASLLFGQSMWSHNFYRTDGVRAANAVFVGGGGGKVYKTVIVPAPSHGGSRWPLLIRPLDGAVLHSGRIDGFTALMPPGAGCEAEVGRGMQVVAAGAGYVSVRLAEPRPWCAFRRTDRGLGVD